MDPSLQTYSAHFTPVAAIVGGLLVGIASSALFLLNGRVCGISGIAGGLMTAPAVDRPWRVAFLAGLLSGGFVLARLDRALFVFASEQSVGVATIAGVLVGFGTRMANGCTSGHGLCGVALGARRSIVATAVFVATGMATVFVTKHLAGVP